MRRVSVQRLLWLFLAPLIVVAACGTGPNADAAVQRAVTATRAAGTAAVTMHLSATGLSTGALEITAHGSIDFAARRSAMTLSYAGQLQVEERIIGSSLYVRSPQWSTQASSIPAGNWLAIDLSKPSSTTGLDLDQLQLGNDDPGQGLTFLAAARKGGAQRFGHDTIGGVRTTHYRVKVDLTKVADEYAPRLGKQSATVDVWIDDDDHLRRAEVPLPLPKDAGDVQATATTDYDRFGQAVTIEAPPPSQVTSYADLAHG